MMHRPKMTRAAIRRKLRAERLPVPAHRGYDRRVELRHLIFQRLIVLSLALLFAACAEPPLGVKIPFAAVWGEQSISCSDDDIALTDLRFFVSEVALVDTEGRSHAVTLDEQYLWQQTDLALVDLEDGKGACQNGSRDVYSYLVGSVPPGIYRGLRFELGVPFERNHANPVTAGPPLDVAAMHWHWRSGYKFMRAGIRSPTDSFWIHLGSAGCQGTTRNITDCTFPNRVSVVLPDLCHDSTQLPSTSKRWLDRACRMAHRATAPQGRPKAAACHRSQRWVSISIPAKLLGHNGFSRYNREETPAPDRRHQPARWHGNVLVRARFGFPVAVTGRSAAT